MDDRVESFCEKKKAVISFFLFLCVCMFCWPQHAYTRRQKGCKIMKHKRLHNRHCCDHTSILHYLWKFFLRNAIVFALFSRFFAFSICAVGHKIMQRNQNRKTHTILRFFSRKHIAKGKNGKYSTLQTFIIDC